MSTTTSIQNHISHYTNVFRQQHKPIYAAVAAGVLTSIALLGRAAIRDYQVYMSYGPGGMPYNVGGWLMTSTIGRLISINMFDVRDLDKNPDGRTWLGEHWPVRSRSGDRPTIGPHPVPQRQLDQHPSAEIQEVRSFHPRAYHANPWWYVKKFLLGFRALVEQYPTLIVSQTSKYERHADALWVNDAHLACALGEGYSREITHIHQNTDYSAHVIVAPRDATKILQSAYGQLHGWAGVKPFGKKLLPKQYVLLYAPRNDEEVELLLGIVKASIGYMTETESMMLP